MAEKIVINSGPLITFARMDALQILDRLPFDFLTPKEVRDELSSGPKDLLSASFPTFVTEMRLTTGYEIDLFDNLDPGEAAVIQLAIEQDIKTVCLDERKGRRVAAQYGLRSFGSLGLLGRAKKLGIIEVINPFVRKALESGVYYDAKLVNDFLERFDEKMSG
jgi:predicted nucleic acid-binding protein